MPRNVAIRRLFHAAATALVLHSAQFAVSVASGASPAPPQKPADAGPIQPIIDGMQGAGARLKQGDAGTGTQRIEEKVVTDLQKLIDEAKPKSSRGNQQQNSRSRGQSGSQDRSQPQGKPASETPAGQADTGQPGRKSGMGKPSVSEKKATGQPQRRLMREVWGHLPPAIRERVPSDFHENILPAYDDLVRRYFEAILDGSSSSGANRPVPVPSPTPGSPAQ